MKKIRLPSLSRGLIPRIDNLRTASKNLLTTFCNDQIKDAKLATRNFFFNFDWYGYRNTELRKSVQRLSTLFQRDLAKTIPFITFASMTYSVENSSRSTLTIGLISHVHAEMIPFKTGMGRSDQTLVDILSTQAGNENYLPAFKKASKVMQRYSDFLNRRCFQNQIPLNVTCTTDLIPTEEAVTLMRNKVEDKTKVEMFEINYKIRTFITVQLGFWNGPNITNFVSLMAGLRHINMTADNVNVTCVEKLFFYLEDFKKPLKTLIRKTSYDTDAFVVGNLQT